ncbi:MAG: flagellar biosynthesis anti-sigma factor FlgM [Bdellovibrionaceae bacterium]|nr:flagellar biosynthesis anti-sigma factor FlgM [Pseudobdellovibrionaceae bacterium]
MKITHNKVGQNLNMVDGAKTERAKNGSPISEKDSVKDAEKLNALADLGGASRVEVSPRAQEARRIKEIALSGADVDEAKVAKFRQLIDDGKYNVDAKAVADRMVDEQLSMDDLKNG